MLPGSMECPQGALVLPCFHALACPAPIPPLCTYLLVPSICSEQISDLPVPVKTSIQAVQKTKHILTSLWSVMAGKNAAFCANPHFWPFALQKMFVAFKHQENMWPPST